MLAIEFVCSLKLEKCRVNRAQSQKAAGQKPLFTIIIIVCSDHYCSTGRLV